jgi:hypothetical protein
VAAGERGLKARSEDEQAAHEREVRELHASSASWWWSSRYPRSLNLRHGARYDVLRGLG